jgi:hypothetical protein
LASSTLPRIWCDASKAGRPDDPILSAPGRWVEIAIVKTTIELQTGAASEQFQKSAAADHVQASYGAGCARDGPFFSFERRDRPIYCRESWVVYAIAIS